MMLMETETLIETERLILTEFTLADVTDKYLGWLQDTEVTRYLEVRHQNYTIESLCEYVRVINQSPNNFFFKIATKSTHEHIGNIKVCTKNYQVGDIGIMIGEKSFWGKGIATESIGITTNWAFKYLKLQKLEAGCYEQNLGSLRVFLKNGYVVEGFLRSHIAIDHERYGCFLLGRTFLDKVDFS